MEQFEDIVGQLASTATPTRLEGVDALKALVERVDCTLVPDGFVREIIDAGNSMAKSHNSKVRITESERDYTANRKKLIIGEIVNENCEKSVHFKYVILGSWFRSSSQRIHFCLHFVFYNSQQLCSAGLEVIQISATKFSTQGRPYFKIASKTIFDRLAETKQQVCGGIFLICCNCSLCYSSFTSPLTPKLSYLSLH